MYMRGMGCAECGGNCDDCQQMAGLGDSSSSSSSSQASTRTQVTTQVSPQISPNFIQQQQPQNSPVNASTTMFPSPPMDVAPMIPNNLPGALPPSGAMIPAASVTPYYDPGYGSYQQSAPVSSGMFGLDNQTLMYVGLGLLAFLALERRHVS